MDISPLFEAHDPAVVEGEDNLQIEMFPHQGKMVFAPWRHPTIEYFFMVAGYNAGKSFTGVLLILQLAWRYQGHHIKIGVGGSTMTLLQKTLLADLFKTLKESGQEYEYSQQRGVIKIGTVEFILIATSVPENIYAHNFSAFICDELDELTQTKALTAFVAIQERTRIPFPDGREPFSVFLTTAQGYRGTYQIYSEIKERGDKYWMIHARSADNRKVSQTWLRRMNAIYNDVERMVFLEGKFANLATGRVYYDYDEEVHRLKVDPFRIEPSDTIHVGQDLNAGFSRGTAVVLRDEVIYVVRNFEFGQIGYAPSMLRMAFPTNEIRWYPDASGAEIIAGYSSEIRQNEISLRMATFNPSVVDRIFFVNKLFKTGRMRLFPACGPLSMALKVRQFNDRGEPEKGKGPTAPDHWGDSFEYVTWRMVYANTVFRDLLLATRQGRAIPKERAEA